jgi:hypothetical protein
MSTSEVTVDRRGGLANVVDIIIGPNAAFDRLRAVPTWGWAFLVAAVLGIIGSLLATPATLHALQTTLPAQLAADPNIAKLPPDQQQAAIQRALSVTKVIGQLSWLFIPIFLLIIAAVQGLIMLIANAIGGGDGSFKKYFALSMNVAIVGLGINSVVTGIIVTLRGPDAFETASAVQSAVPSLALLAPGVKGGLVGFLGAMNIFYLWGAALLALGMVRVGRIKPPVAWTTAVVILLITGLFAAYGASRNG